MSSHSRKSTRVSTSPIAATDPRRFRAEVTCMRPFSQRTDWGPSLAAAKKLITKMRAEYERAGKAAWSDWQILDLTDVTVAAEGTNKFYVRPDPLND